MSDIRAGDLVMVVRGHACDIGNTYHVRSVEAHGMRWWKCRDCGHQDITSEPVAMKSSPAGSPFSWLIKIDPPALPESITEREELTA